MDYVRGDVLMVRERKQSGVCIVSYPTGKAFTQPVVNLSTIISEITTTNVIIGSYDPVLITENNSLKVHPVLYRAGSSKILQVLRYSLLNIKIILKLFSIRHSYGRIIFFMEHPPLLPMFFSILSQKNIYWLLPSKISRLSDSVSSGLETLLSSVCFRASTGIIVYSANLIKEWQLEPYRNKILIAHEHVIDINTFTVTIPLFERPPVIGYIGRFSGEKGILNFIQAIPAIFNDHKDLMVFIGGEGQLKETIAGSLLKKGLTTRVQLPGWISHKDLPFQMNKLRLLVLPSTTEGLPNIMLEAMACGTPVLATPVGAVPDFIKDGETGFIMDNNTPECIAGNINRALKDPDVGNIALNARKMVEREFTFEIAVKQWKRILDDR
jgi:glycosyltransferase involved in cell wall biosynthesis